MQWRLTAMAAEVYDRVLHDLTASDCYRHGGPNKAHNIGHRCGQRDQLGARAACRQSSASRHLSGGRPVEPPMPVGGVSHMVSEAA